MSGLATSPNSTPAPLTPKTVSSDMVKVWVAIGDWGFFIYVVDHHRGDSTLVPPFLAVLLPGS